MKNLLIGLLMLVTTNLMAEPVTKAEPPTFEITTSTICKDSISYHVERSAVHLLVEQMFQYNKLLNKWFPMKCTVA